MQGLCGHFNPALPFSREEIEQYGLNFNESRFTTPHINRQFLSELFEENTEEVIGAYLAQSSSRHYVLKPFCDTQGRLRRCLRIRRILFPYGSRMACLRLRMRYYFFVIQERPIVSSPDLGESILYLSGIEWFRPLCVRSVILAFLLSSP